MVKRFSRWPVAVLAASALTACSPASGPNPAATPTVKPASSAEPSVGQSAALFYAKGGSLYVSDPAGTPGRKLTDGPADTQPAPSPDLAHVAYVRKANASDYGGELWVLDLSPEHTPVGAPRRLVDSAALTKGSVGATTMIVSPRWSPAGKQIAFIDNESKGITGGGRLIVAATDTGAVLPSGRPMSAGERYAWAPDGSHIAWLGGRGDVSPIDVNVFEVGADSVPVAKGTNAFSVTYGRDGQSILFANGDASGPEFSGIPTFVTRYGGIYSAAAPGGSAPDRLAPPTPIFTLPGSYFGDVAALDSGAVAFTEPSADGSSKSIQVLEAGSSTPRTAIANVGTDGSGPVWAAGDLVAYLDASTGNPLVVNDAENRALKQVDTGVDAFAWPPRTTGTTSGGNTVPK
ncbi:MAG: hypothetical protein ACOYEV_16915 [Candidatus Nanopelagicales bacterium]